MLNEGNLSGLMTLTLCTQALRYVNYSEAKNIICTNDNANMPIYSHELQVHIYGPETSDMNGLIELK